MSVIVSYGDIRAITDARKRILIEPPTAVVVQPQRPTMLSPKSPLVAQDVTSRPAAGQALLLTALDVNVSQNPVSPYTATPDSVVSVFLEKYLPRVAEKGAALRDGVRFGEVVELGQVLLEMSSYIVGVGLPQMKGTEAKALVIAIFRWAFRKYLVPSLGQWGTVVEPAIEGLLEVLYVTKVRPEAQKKLAAPN